MTTPELAERVSLTPRRVRHLCDALEARGLVVITREHVGWKGYGTAGRWFRVESWQELPEDAERVEVRAGEVWPWHEGRFTVDPAQRPSPYRVGQDLTYARRGTPVYGRIVWLPEQHARHLERLGRVTADMLEARGL